MAPKSKSGSTSKYFKAEGSKSPAPSKRKRQEADQSRSSNDEVSESGSAYDGSEPEEDYDEDQGRPPPTKVSKTSKQASSGLTASSRQSPAQRTANKPTKAKAQPKPKTTSKAKTPPAKSKSKSKIDTETSETESKRTKRSSSSNTSALEWLLSDEAFNIANPIPERGYGEVDWAKHTSPANPKTAPRPLPKPAPSADEKVKAESKSEAVERAQAGGVDEREVEKNGGGVGSEKETGKKELTSKGIRYPHSPMTPFQMLVCALLLSKPLSHKLGIRTISTLLNPPFEFGKFEILQEADEERRREALWKARTQHKEKTAVQLGDLADGVRGLNSEGEEDSLGGIQRAIEGLDTAQAQKRVGDMLKSIKGIGPGGVGIFLRRVQGEDGWQGVFPYADDRCLSAARVFGLISDEDDQSQGDGAEELGKLVDGDGKKLVRLLDTLIGLDLEKKLHQYAEQFV